MNQPSRLTIILLSIAALGCAIFAYREHSRVIASQTSVESLEKELAALRPKSPQAGKGPIHQPAALGVIPMPGVVQPAKPGSSGPRPTIAIHSEMGLGGGPMSIINNPDVQKLMVLQQRAGLDARYSGLFRRLKLGAADLEKFKNLLVEKLNPGVDAASVARQQGVTGGNNREALQQAIANAEAGVDKRIRTILGDAGFALYQNYEHSAPERGLVTQLQLRLSYSSSPLTDDQTDQLVALLSTSATRATQGSGTPTGVSLSIATSSFGPGPLGSISITDSVIADSRRILAGDQVAALVQLQEEQQAQDQLSARIRSGRPMPTQAGSGPVPISSRP